MITWGGQGVYWGSGGEKAIRYDALDAGGVDNWPYYGDSIVEWGPYTWDDEEEAYLEDPQMIDDMMDNTQ